MRNQRRNSLRRSKGVQGGIALSDRGGFFNDLARTFVKALGSPNYFNHDATCGGNVHNAALDLRLQSLVPDFENAKHLVLYGRNIVESLMVIMAAMSKATVRDHWAAGLEDVRRLAANRDWIKPSDIGPGVRVYDLPG